MPKLVLPRLCLALSLAAALAACSDAGLPTDAAPRTNTLAPVRHPILFVHGFNSTGAVWDNMIARFQADGWTGAELVKWSYNTSQSNAATANLVKAKVDSILAATGAAKVDIVTHSMGGLSSRYYARNLGGDARIDAWVSLGGPNHGTTWAYGCFTTSCVEMRPNSTYLKNLNATDETPGAPRYGTWWSACDTVIEPDNSTPLVGATNTQTACIGHSAFLTDLTTYQQVRAFVHQ
ncbi:MAG TPA: triacylglycerol lipase [Longimicrobium sp.]|nr:triacylglycerol lipase [Longimicrobium sp.]